MTAKMVSNFRRSLSFPNQPSNQKPYGRHVRSASLPCKFHHPFVSHLKDSLSDLKSSLPSTSTSSAWLLNGLSRLRTVLDHLDDILQLPQTHDSLLHRSHWIENLLDDFLCFVDAFGIFQALLLSLKHEHSAAQVALRRKDHSKISFYSKFLKKLGKEMQQLLSTIRSIGGTVSVPIPDAVDAELAEVIGDVKEVTVLVSAALFNAVSSALGSKTSSWRGLRLAPKSAARKAEEEGIAEFRNVVETIGYFFKGEEGAKMALKRMQEMEDCIVGIEVGSERVFRSLINTRVSLLNVLTN